eukprot:GDKJ01036937.1.p1 GENE.GDKJ01036937.1~~GDKJ01036937.1.p1  ORF type:complete len:449 (+),score=129.98 GDKJ01036937.1:154-1347(+)
MNQSTGSKSISNANVAKELSILNDENDDLDEDLRKIFNHEFRKGHPFTPVEMLLALRESGVNVMPESDDLGLVLQDANDIIEDMDAQVALLLAAERKAKKAEKAVAAANGFKSDVEVSGDDDDGETNASGQKKKKTISSRRPLSLLQAEAEARSQVEFEEKKKQDEKRRNTKYVELMKEKTKAVNALSPAGHLYCNAKNIDTELFACREIAHAAVALDFASSDANRFVSESQVLVRFSENPFHETHMDPKMPEFKSDFRSVSFSDNNRVQFVDVDLETNFSEQSLDQAALEKIALKQAKELKLEQKLANGTEAERHTLSNKKHKELMATAIGSFKTPGLVVSPSLNELTHIDLVHALGQASFGVSPLVIPMIENTDNALAKENLRLMLYHMRLMSFG